MRWDFAAGCDLAHRVMSEATSRCRLFVPVSVLFLDPVGTVTKLATPAVTLNPSWLLINIKPLLTHQGSAGNHASPPPEHARPLESEEDVPVLRCVRSVFQRRYDNRQQFLRLAARDHMLERSALNRGAKLKYRGLPTKRFNLKDK